VAADDRTLVRRCLAGDELAYRELVERYQGPVYSVALRMLGRVEDAEDVVQETFVRMFRALDRYDPARPLRARLLTIASRLAIDHWRRRGSRPIPLVTREPGSAGEEREREIADPGLGPEELAMRSDEERRADPLIHSLPPHYRVVVVMRHLQDMSYEEIAAALQLPLGTVKARIHRARALLKERLERRP
jgi:RNA polymerase sigma-70 factor (ECF subfamily)